MTEEQQKILEKIHDQEFKMLCKLDEVCRKHNIDYFLEAGTLIGAVRHKDFVPWDDDIDIYLKRQDFKKLMKYKEELAPYYINIPSSKDGYFWDFTARMINEDVSFKKDDKEAAFYKHMDCHYMFVDLFVMDTLGPGFKGRLQILEMKILYGLAMSRRYKIDYSDYDSFVSKAETFVLSSVGKLFSMKWIFKQYEKLARKYNKKGGSDNYLLSYAAATFLSDCVYKKKWYESTAELPVRDRKFLVPGDYDSSLRNYYGDYMQLPPEDKRVPDHVDSFDVVTFR